MKLVMLPLLLAAWFTDPLPKPANLPVSPHFKVSKLAPGIWAAINNNLGGHAICNAGIIDLGNKTVVIDPFMNIDAAEDLKKLAYQLTGRNPSIIINSHYHNDHIRGNQVFPSATLISSRHTRDLIEASEPQALNWEKANAPGILAGYRKQIASASPEQKKELLLWLGYFEGMVKSGPLIRTRVADLSFTDSLWLHGTKRSLKLVEYPNAHTPSDVAVFVPKEGIVFTGDLLFRESHPWLSDGDPDILRHYLKQWSADPQLKVFVPGHGEVADRSAVTELQYYIQELKELVRAKKEAGLSDSAIISSPIPDAYTKWVFGRRFFEANLAFLCGKK